MARAKKNWRQDPDRLIEICVNEAERAVRLAFGEYQRKVDSFYKKWGIENMTIQVSLSDCYFYYNPKTDTLTHFCTCEPSKDEQDIIVTGIFGDF